ncbi:reverse transcriptase domain-containing protein [Tanacetum coccineum]
MLIHLHYRDLFIDHLLGLHDIVRLLDRSLDSSSPSPGPSRKRCRSLTASVSSSTLVSRSIAPTFADLLPPRKRFRDSYSLEDSEEEHMEVDTADAEAVVDTGISERVVAHPEDGVGMGFKIVASDVREDDEEFEVEASAADTREIVVDPLVIGDSSKSSRGGIPDLEDTIYDIVHYMSEVRIDRIIEITTTQRYIERDRIDSIRWHMALSQEEFRQVRRDRDDTRRRLRRLESTMTITRSGMTPEAIEELINRRVEEALAAHEATRAANALEAENQSQNGSDGDNGNGGNRDGENGNGGNRNGRNNNPYENGRGDRPVNWRMHYLISIEMETVFHISNCPEKSQVKYATCILLNSALTWNEIQKMETELWNLTVKNNDLTAYTQRFQELTMMCTKMVPEEEDRVEKLIRGLPDNIQGNVIAAEPIRLQDAVRIANNLIDQKLKGYAVKNTENKRRLEVNQRDNHGQQPPFKRPNVGGQNVVRAYMAGNNEKKPYNGLLPLCNKCKLHHEGPCTVRCGKCNKVGHLTQDCKDQNHGNKAKNKNRVGEAGGKAYVLGGGDANPDSNVVKGTFLLNNHYAFILFDSGADRSFMSTTFSTLLDITTDTLDISYVFELADGRISETNTVLRGYTLGLLCRPFNIDLMPVELGSFDAIIGMDWLANVMPKEIENESEEKRLKDVPNVRDFPEVFPEDLPGLSPTR